MTSWVHPHRSDRTAGRTTWADRWLIEIGVALLIGFLVWQGALAWFDSDQAITHFPQALNWATLPRPASGYHSVTPALLNREQPGRADIGHYVRYVGPTTASTGPFVVSVNPIDSNTWSAVALGDNGKCYATLIYSDPDNPNYGGTDYGLLPTHSGCRGIEANRDSVTSQQTPQ